MNSNVWWLCRGLRPIVLLLSFFAVSPSFSQSKRTISSSDQTLHALRHPIGSCTQAIKLFSNAYQISFWGGPAREAAIAYTDPKGDIHIYDSEDGIFGNGGKEGSWIPYAPQGTDANPQLWGRYLAFSRTEYNSTVERSIMIMDLGVNGRSPGTPVKVVTAGPYDYFSAPRIMGWYTGEPYLSWIHFPSNGTPVMYACPLSQCIQGNPIPITMNTVNPIWSGFVVPPLGQYPILLWNEAFTGQPAHVVTQNGAYIQHWPLGNCRVSPNRRQSRLTNTTTLHWVIV